MDIAKQVSFTVFPEDGDQKTACNFYFKCGKIERVEGCSKSQTDIRRLFTTDAWIRTQFSVCGTSDGQSGRGTSFSTSTSVFPCHYHPTCVPHPFSFNYSSAVYDRNFKRR